MHFGTGFHVRLPEATDAQPSEVIVNWPALLEKASGAE